MIWPQCISCLHDYIRRFFTNCKSTRTFISPSLTTSPLVMKRYPENVNTPNIEINLNFGLSGRGARVTMENTLDREKNDIRSFWRDYIYMQVQWCGTSCLLRCFGGLLYCSNWTMAAIFFGSTHAQSGVGLHRPSTGTCIGTACPPRLPVLRRLRCLHDTKEKQPVVTKG